MKHWLPLALACCASAQQVPERPPVIDMHVHSTNTTPTAAAELNLRYIFLSALAPDLPKWAESYGRSYLPGIVFPCDSGRAPITGRLCFDNPTDFPDPAWLRKELEAGRIKAFGELSPQYEGISPQDVRFETYWKLAEEFDIPVGIHMGPGPPGAAYDSNPVPFKSPSFRMSFGDPILLEDVLLKHKKLRLFVMHAGWPRLESMIALLYAHPNIYVDVAALSTESMVPRASYYSYLRALVDAGFSKRIMFGSDFPNQVKPGIDAILGASFLTREQKSDILCDNASRFLRLPVDTCATSYR
jgi:Amidohydrolase